MRTLIIIATFFFIAKNLFGQNCNCPRSNISGADKPSKIFKFSNGKTLGLCGSSETLYNEKTYSEVVLYQCGQDTNFIEIGGTETCTIEQNKDTLIIQEFYPIANDKNLKVKWTKFYVTKVFWKKSLLEKKCYFRNDLRKYSNDEIEKVLSEYRITKKEYNSERILLIGHRLFWAYVSGSKLAGQYLGNSNKKFGDFDGAIAEEYDDLIATYELYRKK